jgi:hypothetical protein
MLTGTNEQVALELVTKAKKALVDSGLLFKDFSRAEQIGFVTPFVVYRTKSNTGGGFSKAQKYYTIYPLTLTPPVMMILDCYQETY